LPNPPSQVQSMLKLNQGLFLLHLLPLLPENRTRKAFIHYDASKLMRTASSSWSNQRYWHALDLCIVIPKPILWKLAKEIIMHLTNQRWINLKHQDHGKELPLLQTQLDQWEDTQNFNLEELDFIVQQSSEVYTFYELFQFWNDCNSQTTVEKHLTTQLKYDEVLNNYYLHKDIWELLHTYNLSQPWTNWERTQEEH
jgi:hypothetical protein